MKLPDFAIATAILSKYSDNGELEYVPNSFPNGTPNNPATLYFKVDVEFPEKITEAEVALLKSLGWKPEDEGEFWVFYQ